MLKWAKASAGSTHVPQHCNEAGRRSNPKARAKHHDRKALRGPGPMEARLSPGSMHNQPGILDRELAPRSSRSRS